MIRKKKSLLPLVGAALALTASGYAATGGVHGIRASNRPSSPGNGHCGHDGGPPPCRPDQSQTQPGKSRGHHSGSH